LVFVDEVHEARNVERKAILGKAIRQVCRKAYKTVGLTGTPVWNKPHDMVGVLQALDTRSYLTNPEEWGHAIPRTAVQQCCRLFIHRVKECDIHQHQLPSLSRTTVEVQHALDPVSIIKYNDLYKTAMRAIFCQENRILGAEYSSMDLILCLGEMARLVLHPKLNDAEYALAHPSAKLTAATRTIQEMLQRHSKIVVAANSVQFLKLVETQSQILGCELLDGTVSAEGRAHMVQRFLDPAGPRVLFLSMRAGGTGLNITPGATGMLVLDYWYSPAIHRQTEKRIHRRGQTHPVEIVNLVCSGTIESAILVLHGDKTDCAEMMVGDAKMQTSSTAWRKHARILAACQPLSHV
jgi:SNF2 family DNA or RNA helicase